MQLNALVRALIDMTNGFHELLQELYWVIIHLFCNHSIVRAPESIGRIWNDGIKDPFGFRNVLLDFRYYAAIPRKTHSATVQFPSAFHIMTKSRFARSPSAHQKDLQFVAARLCSVGESKLSLCLACLALPVYFSLFLFRLWLSAYVVIANISCIAFVACIYN